MHAVRAISRSFAFRSMYYLLNGSCWRRTWPILLTFVDFGLYIDDRNLCVSALQRAQAQPVSRARPSAVRHVAYTVLCKYPIASARLSPVFQGVAPGGKRT